MVSPGSGRHAPVVLALIIEQRVVHEAAGFLDAIMGAGVDVVQLREKEAEAGDLLRWGEVFREAAERHGALFAVNDRPDVAVALGAVSVRVIVTVAGEVLSTEPS